jgi:hypothetical protein
MSPIPRSQKILPRNAAAFRAGANAERMTRLVPGNPVSTRLESGVGNCFPGLEIDLRNFERRFFPFLAVDFVQGNGGERVLVADVDSTGVDAAAQAGSLDVNSANIYRTIAADLAAGNRTWHIVTITGAFGPLGSNRTFDLTDLPDTSTGQNREPTSAWTAIRLLFAGSQVEITLRRTPGNMTRTLRGARQSYLDDTGALSSIFAVGEMSQSLCSPWTHDFRDCGCWYWASNHPDITMPPLPAPAPNDARWYAPVHWQRRNLTVGPNPPAPATGNGQPDNQELRYHEINRRWQELNIVLEGRERQAPYVPGRLTAPPYASISEVVAQLRYLAGVELGVIHEYVAAAYSLRPDSAMPAGDLRDDVRAARAELLRIAFSEMRHLRLVNDVLRLLTPTGTAFLPALRVATLLPVPGVGDRPVQARPLTQAVLAEFVAIEAPAGVGEGIDGRYGRVLATLELFGTQNQAQAVRQIIAEGADHYDTFRFISEWLSSHAEPDYVRPGLSAPQAAEPQNVVLQQRYLSILDRLFTGYSAGPSAGAPDVNAARSAMLGGGGIQGAAEALANANKLVVFEVPNDPRFAPIAPPP